MSIAESVAEIVVVSIRLFWRTHDEFGLIPAHKQQWWFDVADAEGGLLSAPLADWAGDDVSNIAEAVVAVGEQCGAVVGIDQVKVDTVHSTATWVNGA